jgi:hypothetical protein
MGEKVDSTLHCCLSAHMKDLLNKPPKKQTNKQNKLHTHTGIKK